ncbi:MAG: diaminopimelate decarboxylase [Bacteroidota bacterium]
MELTNALNRIDTIRTPYYLYDINILERTLGILKKLLKVNGFKVHYAVKANSNSRIMQRIARSGLGADCVSGNEILKALECGFRSDEIVYAGVGKTDAEIETALRNNIFCINCESIQEIRVVDEIASKLDCVARIALRLNPDVNPETHRYISTGNGYTKFGINISGLDAVLDVTGSLLHTRLTGLHFHVGSQIGNMDVFRDLCFVINEMQNKLESRGINIGHINVGGGLGINYYDPDKNLVPDFESYFQVFCDHLKIRPGRQLHFELGRSIVAQCCSLICRVLYTKTNGPANFVITDAGMTELIRPALYEAYHKIHNLTKESASNYCPETELYDVVGPICETSDFLGKNISLPLTERGDLLAVRSVGAYGEVMASNYNLRDKAKAYFLNN